MRKFLGVHEYFKNLSSTEYQARDGKAALGMTPLDELSLLSCDEFLWRTALYTADINIKNKDIGSPFDAKRYYKQFSKWIHWRNLIHKDTDKTLPVMGVFLEATIPLHSETRTAAKPAETQPKSAALFNHMRIFRTDSASQKRADNSILACVPLITCEIDSGTTPCLRFQRQAHQAPVYRWVPPVP